MFIGLIPFGFFVSFLGSLFLNKEVDVVDSQRCELLNWAAERHEKTSVGHVGVAAITIQSVYHGQREPKQAGSKFRAKNSHLLSVKGLLELVDLAVAHVVVGVGDGGGGVGQLAGVAPALVVVLGAVVVEGGGHDNEQGVADGAGEQLDVDVEGHLGLVVCRDALDARDPVVLGLVVVGDLEPVLKEGCVCSAGHFDLGFPKR